MGTALTKKIACACCGGSGRVVVFDGSSLRKRRQLTGVTLRELARRIKVSAAFVSDIELGRRQPSAFTMERIMCEMYER